MQRSTDRILTTHAGSLPREAVDEGPFAARVIQAVNDTVARQTDAGVDIVGDGEQGRVGFILYVNERLDGITPSPTVEAANDWGLSREYQAFPAFYAWATAIAGAAGNPGRTRGVCTGPVSYKGHAALAKDIATLKSALAEGARIASTALW